MSEVVYTATPTTPTTPTNRIKYHTQGQVVLKLWVDPTVEGLRQLYEDHVHKHNTAIRDNLFANAGFDVFVPTTTTLPPGPAETQMLKLKIKAEMYSVVSAYTDVEAADEIRQASAYFLLPRSSMSKTPLMQSNHLGLIDAGYRGEIMAPVRNLSMASEVVTAGTRLFQLCHPYGTPIHVTLVEEVSELSTTDRGEGGFGSTGVQGALVTEPELPVADIV